MQHRDSYIVYLLIEGLFALFFGLIVTVNLVYQVEVAHLNPLQLVLVGTTLEVIAFLFQVPTGVIADVFSRRMSIIIGLLLTGAGFVLEGSIPRFEFILLSQLGWGIGSSFISGAEEAWIAGEVGEEKVGHVFLRGMQVGSIGSLIGIVFSVALASIRLNLPIIIGGGLIMLLGMFLLFFMPEHNFGHTHDEERPSWRKLGQTFLAGGKLVRRSTLLLTILSIGLFYGLTSEGIDRLWVAHLLTNFTLPTLGVLQPVVWFGILRGGTTIFSIGAAEIVRRRFDTSNNKTVARLLFVLSALQIASTVAFGLAGNFALAVGTFWSLSILRSTINPIYMTWLAQNIDARVRATVISMAGQLDAIGQIAGGPMVGVIGTLVSIRAALVATGALLLPALAFFPPAIRREKDKPVA